MSQKVFPIFDKKREKKHFQSSVGDDDCIVYLGEELTTDSKKSDHAPIKQESIDQMNESTSEIFQLYSQEQDSIIDDESVFHNSFAKIEESNPTVEEDDEDDDEDIKLIYDSRDLIEQICRKYDTIETKKEKTTCDDHSPIVVKKKCEPSTITIVEQNSDDSDMDILLCSAADEYEKNNPTPSKPSSKLIEPKKGIESIENFKTLKDCLFGDDLDSLSSDEELKKNDKIVLSSRTPDPQLKTNSSTKRTFSTDFIQKSKKQRLSSNEEMLFYIERPPKDLKRCQIRRPLFSNAPKSHNEITSKKNVELMLNKKFKPSTSTNRDLTLNLTQSMNLARQENQLREKIRKESVFNEEKNKCEPVKQQIVVSAKENKHKKSVVNNTDVVGSILNQMNVQQNNKNEKIKSSCFFFENFLHRILKWSYNWLEEQNKFSSEMKQMVPPPVVEDQELGPLIDSYLSYEDYYKTMFPLLLAETWEEIFNEWKDSKRNELKTYQNSSILLKSVDKVSRHQELMAITFQILMDSGHKGSPCEDDLLRLSLKVKNKETVTQSNYFGIVRGSKRLKTDDPTIMNAIKDLIKEKEEINKKAAYSESRQNSIKNINVYEFNVYVRSRGYVTVTSLKVDYQIITSLSSSFRRAKALLAFQNSSLQKTILNVSQLDPAFWIKEPEKELKLSLSEFNESQKKVIVQCSSILKYNEPKLCFIQGPPGTGKSHTIVGIINALFTRLFYLKRSSAKQPKANEKKLSLKILICSPSNGGCDELVRRIKKLKEKSGSAISDKVLCREAKIVRVGRTENIHKDCEEMTLDYVFKKAFDKLIMEKKTAKSESLMSHYKNLQFHEKKFTLRVKEFKVSGKHKELKEAEKELEELKIKIKKFENQLAKNKSNEISYGDRKKLEAQAKEKILNEADIIISTLNFSGNSLLDCLTSEKNNGNAPISVIIIDEAAQCLEVDSLIPLRFGCDKIIQVGDPEQLPATVLSKISQEKGFGMSLFERVYQRFKYVDKSPIRMLYVQYRMHPDICEFPSKNFYKNKLKTDEETIQKRSCFDLRPYLFFNVIKGQEVGDELNGSVFNPVEGEHILEFCKYLCGKYSKFSIGIITPYQKQVGYLRDLLARNNLINKMEVGTVDSFQGREKDIVIFSCVRARNANRSIGFLAHRQRLNVALTRAKLALFIFGHIESLIVNSDWNNCVQDAKKKSLIIDLQ